MCSQAREGSTYGDNRRQEGQTILTLEKLIVVQGKEGASFGVEVRLQKRMTSVENLIVVQGKEGISCGVESRLQMKMRNVEKGQVIRPNRGGKLKRAS